MQVRLPSARHRPRAAQPAGDQDAHPPEDRANPVPPARTGKGEPGGKLPGPGGVPLCTSCPDSAALCSLCTGRARVVRETPGTWDTLPPTPKANRCRPTRPWHKPCCAVRMRPGTKGCKPPHQTLRVRGARNSGLSSKRPLRKCLREAVQKVPDARQAKSLGVRRTFSTLNDEG
jgi:hypothetical protein